ncbi:hypothetical protein GOP47_0001214 [Adiantum capillus-veneris]|uniref:ATPase domain-containing protein n=1 Tax=Adiantum capillus-veneris TaxID=13818 RepID=A0A9D4ZTU0_ADICA|nr:hypothetical protein GOP47_0001214 [Adiantum capillus-veneris]
MASLLRAAKRLGRPFFNRSEEMRGLERMLTGGDGKLVLVTGPCNSGKSALLQQFMDWQVEHERGHPILVDMRSGQYSTASSFASELKAQSTSVFLPAASAVLSRLPVQNVANEALKGLVDGLKAHMDAVENATQTDMMELLKALEGLFLNWAAIARRYAHSREATYPTMVIDEANMLHQ